MEFTKENWKELIKHLNKQGKITNPLDNMLPHHREMFEKALKEYIKNNKKAIVN